MICCVTIDGSLPYSKGIIAFNGILVRPSSISDEIISYLYERLSFDIVSVMRDLKIDMIELALLKSIFLFDPG